MTSASTAAQPFGRRLAEVRRAAGLTQRDLADLTFMDPSNIGRIERGKVNPNLETMARLAAALDTTVSDLTRYVTTDHLGHHQQRLQARELTTARAELKLEIMRSKQQRNSSIGK